MTNLPLSPTIVTKSLTLKKVQHILNLHRFGLRQTRAPCAFQGSRQLTPFFSSGVVGMLAVWMDGKRGGIVLIISSRIASSKREPRPLAATPPRSEEILNR